MHTLSLRRSLVCIFQIWGQVPGGNVGNNKCFKQPWLIRDPRPIGPYPQPSGEALGPAAFWCAEQKNTVGLLITAKNQLSQYDLAYTHTLLGTNISPEKSILKMSFLFPRWDKLVPYRVYCAYCRLVSFLDEIRWIPLKSNLKFQCHLLVGGWTTPFEKYARQIGAFPQVGVNKKNGWNHHLVTL